MCADADYLAMLQHNDLVGIGDGRHSLPDDDHRRLGRFPLKRRPKPRIRGNVERGERVVENEDLRPPHQCSRDGQTLPLPTGDIRAAL